jgi:magnesium transporter
MVIDLLAGALAGVFIPLVQKRMGIDPALAGGTILTTVTDCCGYGSFLGLATWMMLR